MKTPDFLVIGGGVIGMMTALQLAEAGHTLTLVERGQCGHEASWAGGGIVSPLYPWRHSEPVSALSMWAENAYPALAARLAEDTGIDPEYRPNGLLYLDTAEESEAAIWAQAYGKPLTAIGAHRITHAEPELNKRFDRALWMPSLGSIRNPRLCRALRARLAGLPGVTLREGVAVEQLQREGDRFVGARTRAGLFTAGRTIVAAGAWTAALVAGIGPTLPICPVKGQMICYRTPRRDRRMLVEHVVLHRGRYLIPRADGRLLVGSTLENAGYDKTTTNEARDELRKAAIDTVPALAGCEIEAHWAGLRPGAPGGIPFIGAVASADGLYVNAGHHRSGLTLAPAAARLLADQLLGHEPIVDPAPYRPALPDAAVLKQHRATTG